jgi:uncharacterized protein (TIGR04255 family)
LSPRKALTGGVSACSIAFDLWLRLYGLGLKFPGIAELVGIRQGIFPALVHIEGARLATFFAYIRSKMSPKVRPHYANAPIAEAVIDVRVQSGPTLDFSKLTALADALKERFPARLPMSQMQMGFDVQDPNMPARFINSQQQTGWRLTSKDQDRVALLQTVSFTFSHLPPYTDWETFSSEAQQIWGMYIDAVKPEIATRAAVRVINRIPIPAHEFNIDSYLNIYPKLPEAIPTLADVVFMQLQLPMTHVDASAKAVLNLATGQSGPDGSTSLILDIDLAVERTIALQDELWSLLDHLGSVKDDIFEACITDVLREKIR